MAAVEQQPCIAPSCTSTVNVPPHQPEPSLRAWIATLKEVLRVFTDERGRVEPIIDSAVDRECAVVVSGVHAADGVITVSVADARLPDDPAYTDVDAEAWATYHMWAAGENEFRLLVKYVDETITPHAFVQMCTLPFALADA